MSEKPGYNPESPENKDRESESIAALPEVQRLRELHPVFASVAFEEVNDPAFEGGSFRLPSDDGEPPAALIASGGPERFASLKETRKEAIEAMAHTLGREAKSLTGEDIRNFILFHEAGHAEDFITNFSSDVQAWRANMMYQLETLPLSGVSPAELREEISTAGGFENWLSSHEDNATWCASHGVNNERELFAIQEAAYRALDKESYADKFAARMIRELSENEKSAQ